MTALLEYLDLFCMILPTMFDAIFLVNLTVMQQEILWNLNNNSRWTAYYAGIILDSFCHQLFQKLFPHNVCMPTDETVDHLVSSCSYFVQREYKGRHDAIAPLIHLKQAGCQVQSPWWRHTPTTVWENDEYKVLWDFLIVTDSVICHDRPDIVLMHKTSNEIFMVDVAIPEESCISQKIVEKLSKYVDLVSRLWKTFEVPIIGALGTVSIDLPSYMESLNLPFYLIAVFQRTGLFRTSSILRRYLQIWAVLFVSSALG